MDSVESHSQTDHQKSTESSHYDIPKYTIDLSLPPDKRYEHLVHDFSDELHGLPELFNEVLQAFFPRFLIPIVHVLARVFLSRLHSDEESRELRGISRLTGIDMFLLVALNVLLDALMGCTSGGVRVRDRNGDTSMLHFRTLDWGMDPLRKIICQLDFVNEAGGPVIARSVTYVGFVGVLTGVRKDLSMSLNFRPHHETTTWKSTLRYVWHVVLVLFGYRQSISSLLREHLLSQAGSSPLANLLTKIQPLPSTAAYLIFSDGQETVSLEKDNYSGHISTSDEFIVTLNHDLLDENLPGNLEKATSPNQSQDPTGMADLVKYSVERKKCAARLWKHTKRSKRGGVAANGTGPSITEAEAIGWMEGDEIVNEETHYAVIMDPKAGNVIWSRRWLEPNDVDSLEEAETDEKRL